MKSRTSQIIIVAATLLGLFFGNAINGLVGALVLGTISAAGAWYAMSRYEATTAAAPEPTTIQDPPIARFLLQDTRAAALWLPLRLFLGWEWLDAGLHKFSNAAWMDTGVAIRGYWERAVAVNAETGTGPITYEWWRGFIQMLLDTNAHTWFAKVIVLGEIAIGLGLIVGALVGVAAVAGVLMNLSFLLSGSTSSNPVMLTLAILVVLAWKVAGFVGIDRVLLPLLGTPWQHGKLAQPKTHRPTASPTSA